MQSWSGSWWNTLQRNQVVSLHGSHTLVPGGAAACNNCLCKLLADHMCRSTARARRCTADLAGRRRSRSSRKMSPARQHLSLPPARSSACCCRCRRCSSCTNGLALVVAGNHTETGCAQSGRSPCIGSRRLQGQAPCTTGQQGWTGVSQACACRDRAAQSAKDRAAHAKHNMVWPPQCAHPPICVAVGGRDECCIQCATPTAGAGAGAIGLLVGAMGVGAPR